MSRNMFRGGLPPLSVTPAKVGSGGTCGRTPSPCPLPHCVGARKWDGRDFLSITLVEAGFQLWAVDAWRESWVPAFAGMTDGGRRQGCTDQFLSPTHVGEREG